jgi:hypothetical protein
MSQSSASMPQEIKGIIFTEIIPQLIPEVSPADLIRLGAIVRKKNRSEAYEPLTDSLRKIQWVKLVSLEAVSIEREIAGQMEPGSTVSYPFGQVKHSLAVTDSMIHTKSALDSMAVFLTDLLRLDARGAGRDFKHTEFRREVSAKDPILRVRMKELEPWFKELQGIRDEWIHRSSIRNMLIIGPSDVGVLPIPKRNLDVGLKAFDLPITHGNFWSTSEFLDHHYMNLVTLFRAIVDRCIEIESASLTEPVPVDLDAEKGLVTFLFKTTQDMTVTKAKVKLGPFGF